MVYGSFAGLLLAGALWHGDASGQRFADPRDAFVEEIRNDAPGFLVRVYVDHRNRVYRGGDAMRVAVRSEREGYLYLFYVSAEKKVRCLFPNKLQQANKIPAKRAVFIPPAGANYRIRIGEPFGDEVLKAVVSLKPLQKIELDSLTQSAATSIAYQAVKDAYIEELRPNPVRWAEHGIRIKTYPRDTKPPVERKRRVAVFIGISVYKDNRIPELSVCHVDAQAMAELMQRHGQLDQSFVLTNNQATLRNIEDVIRRKIAAITRPGDLVLIYWSGHGGRCADEAGDEKDGLDEYLVPADGNIENPERIRQTMLMDDTLGRWIQQLDGRQIVFILDTCYSGGQATHEKSIEKHVKRLPLPGIVATGEFDFLDGEFARVKDIGQPETAVMASSLASQISLERREGDLSTMTYFLKQAIETGNQPVTLKQAFDYLTKNVPEYVKQRFPGITQTPVLVNQTTPPVYIRP